MRMSSRTGGAYCNPGATLDDFREALTMFEDAGRIARRVLGGAHPVTKTIEHDVRDARAALRAREAGKRVIFEYNN